MDKLSNGCVIDPKTKRFLPTDKEKTTTITIRLPESMASQIKAIPNRQDWLREVLSQALEDRASDYSVKIGFKAE